MNYVKLILLSYVFIWVCVKASAGDYILLIVLVEFAFKIGFNYINSISIQFQINFTKNILKMLNIINLEFDFLYGYMFLIRFLSLILSSLLELYFVFLVISILVFLFYFFT